MAREINFFLLYFNILYNSQRLFFAADGSSYLNRARSTSWRRSAGVHVFT